METAPKPNTREIERTLDLIAATGQIVELRLLNVEQASTFSCTMSGYFNDYGKLAAVAAKQSR
jgi:hypothetical protein